MMLKDKDEIINIINKTWNLGIPLRHIDINEEYQVSLIGKVKLNAKGLKCFPFQFLQVDGDFFVNHNPLTSLVGAPKIVKGDFDCAYNQIETLEGGPLTVTGSYGVAYNNLTSLSHIATNIGEGIYVSSNKLLNLHGLPKVLNGNLDISGNHLTSFEGCSEIIKGELRVYDNPLSSIAGFPKEVQDVIILDLFINEAQYLNDVLLITAEKYRVMDMDEFTKLLLAHKLDQTLDNKKAQNRLKI